MNLECNESFELIHLIASASAVKAFVLSGQRHSDCSGSVEVPPLKQIIHFMYL